MEIRARMMAIATITDDAHAKQLAAQASALAEAAGAKLLVLVRKARELEASEAANVAGKRSPADPDEVLAVELSDRERKMLSWGVVEWGGPARCTDEMAIAMGFASVEEIFTHGPVLYEWIKSSSPMRRFDWLRALLLTEIVYASQVLGSGSDWPITSGIPDDESLQLLRSLQRKIGATGIYSLVGAGFGTRRKK